MRRLITLLLALVVAATIQLAVPRITVACSCVDPAMILTMAADDPSSVVFTGETGPAVGSTVPVSVTGWYGGPAPTDIVMLDVQGGDSASCGMNPPPAGNEYLFGAYESSPGQLGINACSLVADLGTPEGQALQAQADAALGPPSPPPEAAPSAPPDDSLSAQLGEKIPIIVVLLFGVGFLAGIYLILRRRQTPEG